ncbi:hypothetical protein JOQ06_024134, partial [Pogonophryne albipinna]
MKVNGKRGKEPASATSPVHFHYSAPQWLAISVSPMPPLEPCSLASPSGALRSKNWKRLSFLGGNLKANTVMCQCL